MSRSAGEAAIALAWAERQYDPLALVDAAGVRYHVVYPGRRTGGPGPDFQGALLALADGTLLRGDVEVHRRSSDWRRHGHGADPAYAQVVLHVVAQRDDVTVRPGGLAVPTVELRTLVLPLQQPATSCAARGSQDVLQRVLEAGERRFLERAARLEADLAVVGPCQALWRAVLEGLGYSRNRDPMARLAEHAPWTDALVIVRDAGERGLASWLLGTAGLVDAMAPDEWTAWQRVRLRQGARTMMAAQAWQRIGVRPANLPEMRLRGLAALAERWARAWPRRQFGDLALEAVGIASGEARPRPERFFQAQPYVGAGRARVLVANALLPWAHAVGNARALPLYERLPGEPPNQATRHMAAELGLAPRDLRTMRAQQGLLHLFKQACSGRWCEHCPARAPVQAGGLVR